MTISEQKSNLYEKSSLSTRSPSSSISSSFTTINGLPRSRFDDRATTKTSLALQEYKKTSFNNEKKTQWSDEQAAQGSMFKWSPLSKINHIIESSSFISERGTVLQVVSNSIYIAVSTSKSIVVIFNYKQSIEAILNDELNKALKLGQELTREIRRDPRHELDNDPHFFPTSFRASPFSATVEFTKTAPKGKISAMAFSSDSSFFVAGYENGLICVWDLNSNRSRLLPSVIRPFFTIYPKLPRARSETEGHVINTLIKSVRFLHPHNNQIMSIDASGLSLFHRILQKLMTRYATSNRLCAKKVQMQAQLPLGSAYEITDEMGVISLLSNDDLMIISSTSLNDPEVINLRQQYTYNIRSNTSNQLSMSWFPCSKKPKGVGAEGGGKGVVNAKLACSWGNILHIIELDNEILPSNLRRIVEDAKDKDRAVPKLPFKRTCKWHEASNIVDSKWILTDILCVFLLMEDTSGLQMKTYYYDGSTLIPIAKDEICGDVQKVDLAKQSLLALKDAQLYMGRQLSWADLILRKVSLSQYQDALQLADEYYQTSSAGLLAAVGLPTSKDKRLKLLYPYFLDIMRASMPSLSKDFDPTKLHIYFDVLTYAASDDILEELLESVDDDRVYFEVLEPYILFGTIKVLPPNVLKHLIKHYVSIGEGELLTELLCTLDIKSLDIDLAIKLCKEYRLNDCLIYIWNILLNDYQTPFFDFVQEYSSPQFELTEQSAKAYTYMTYILTGRQYPTDRLISNNNNNNNNNDDGGGAKGAIRSMCDALFSHTAIEKDGALVLTQDKDIVFPYLYLFLKQSSILMMSALNEFFESSFLNENEKYNRQYLLEVLIDLFRVNESSFTEFDKCQLAIFIARNYPKYFQLLRLPESILDTVINRLCSNTNATLSEDCELALCSLIPLYTPDDEMFVEKLKLSKFYNVLFDIFNAQGKYSRALEIWLMKRSKNDGHDASSVNNCNSVGEGDDPCFAGDNSFAFETMNVLESALIKTQDVSEKLNVAKVIKSNFDILVSLDWKRFLQLVNRYVPSMHTEILDINNDKIAFAYIKTLFSMHITDLDPFLYRYIQLMIKDDRVNAVQFVEKWGEKIVRSSSRNQIEKVFDDFAFTEGKACLLENDKDHQGAVDCILAHLQRISKHLRKQDQRQRFTSLLSYCFAICENYGNLVNNEGDETYKSDKIAKSYENVSGNGKYNNENLHADEKLWLKIINFLVEMANTFTFGEEHLYFNQCVQNCFRRLSDYKLTTSDGEQSFLAIFNTFLSQHSKSDIEKEEVQDLGQNLGQTLDQIGVATLSNIRGVLQEVFISYSYELEMLKISLKMLNSDVYKRMLMIRGNKLKGWAIKSAKDCCACGKSIGGNKEQLGEPVFDEHVLAWEDSQQQQLLLIKPVKKPANDVFENEADKGKDQLFHFLELTYFKCGHAYHTNCLEKLRSAKHCVLCAAPRH